MSDTWPTPGRRTEERSKVPPPPPPGSSTAPPPPPPPPPPPGGRPRGTAGGEIIPLEPLNLGQKLDGVFSLYRATFLQVAIAVTIPLVVFGALGAALVLAVVPSGGFDDASGPGQIAGLVATILLLAGGFVLVLQPMINGAVTAIAARADQGRPATWLHGFGVAARRFWALLGALLLTGLVLVVTVAVFGFVVVVGVGAFALAGNDPPVLLVVVGVLLLIAAVVVGIALLLALTSMLYVVVPVVILEDAGPLTALRRSYRLIRPRIWRTVGTVILAGILIQIAATLVAQGFGLLGGLLPEAIVWVPFAVGQVLSQVVAIPLFANLALMIYVDARVRDEGLDLQQLTARLR